MSNLGEQVAAARTGVLAVPRPDLTVLVVTGKDRISWLNGLVTCDLVKWPPAEARYGLVAARSGRVLADVILVAAGDRVLAVVPAEVTERLREHLDHYLVMEDAEIGPAADAYETWHLSGPRWQPVLAAAREAGGTGAAFDLTGLGGAVVMGPPDRAAAVRAAIEGSLGTTSGVLGDSPGWEALRLERAVPRFGVDFDDKTYPQEASLEKTAVSFEKGCYLGQEVVCMLEMRGHVKRKLVAIVLEGAAVPAAGAEVTDASGAAVGEITSSAMSPTLGVPVALAMVKRAVAVAGAEVTVKVGGGVHAKVVDRPA